jgi:hypothetical protein
LGDAFPLDDIIRDAHSNADRDFDSHAIYYAHRNAHSHAHGNADRDFDSHAISYAHRDANSHAYGDADRDFDSRAISYAHRNTNSHAYGDAHIYAHADLNLNPDRHADPNAMALWLCIPG